MNGNGNGNGDANGVNGPANGETSGPGELGIDADGNLGIGPTGQEPDFEPGIEPGYSAPPGEEPGEEVTGEKPAGETTAVFDVEEGLANLGNKSLTGLAYAIDLILDSVLTILGFFPVTGLGARAVAAGKGLGQRATGQTIGGLITGTQPSASPSKSQGLNQGSFAPSGSTIALSGSPTPDSPYGGGYLYTSPQGEQRIIFFEPSIQGKNIMQSLSDIVGQKRVSTMDFKSPVEVPSMTEKTTSTPVSFLPIAIGGVILFVVLRSGK